MKKISIFLISCSLLLLTSCIDYVQAISLDGDNFNGYMKITLSKTLMALAGEDGDINQLFNEDTLGELPPEVSMSSIDTDLELGFDVKVSANKDMIKEELGNYIPFNNPEDNNIHIPFIMGIGMENDTIEDSVKGKTDDDGQAMAALLLSTVKCKIMVDKKIVPSMENAYFKGLDGADNYNIPFFDYGNGYCIEVPFILLISEMPYDFSYVIVE